MDEKLLKFFQEAKVPEHWDAHTKADELGRWALEAGMVDLPDMYEVTPKEYDRAIEDAYEFLRGEAQYFLEEKR